MMAYAWSREHRNGSTARIVITPEGALQLNVPQLQCPPAYGTASQMLLRL